MGEGFVEIAGLLLQDACRDFYACCLKFGDTLSSYEWVGIDGGDDAAGDSCRDKGVGARAGAPVMAARLEGDVSSSTLG